MTLFVLRCTRGFQTVLPIVCTLSVAWVTKIYFDTCGNCFWFFIYSSTQLNHITLHLWDGCIFMGSFLIFLTGTQVLLKLKTVKGYRKHSTVRSDCMSVLWLCCGHSPEAIWPLFLVTGLFWCLQLRVYLQAYISQLNSKYKMTDWLVNGCRR